MMMTDQPKYEWATPFEWLTWAVAENKVSTDELLNLLSKVDSDLIQDEFQSAMNEDGYFDVYKTCPDCGEEIKIGVDGVEEASFADHGKCWSCHQEWMMGNTQTCPSCHSRNIGPDGDGMSCDDCQTFWGAELD
jgi:hypothetical protein